MWTLAARDEEMVVRQLEVAPQSSQSVAAAEQMEQKPTDEVEDAWPNVRTMEAGPWCSLSVMIAAVVAAAAARGGKECLRTMAQQRSEQVRRHASALLTVLAVLLLVHGD
jgi:hypothetical protein